MTASVQTSFFTSHEIEAYTMAEAAEIAQSRFGADAYNMNIYSVSEF